MNWQPISTAPKETALLLATEFFGKGDWRIKCGSFYGGEWHVWGASWAPSHWMPLPAAPGEECLTCNGHGAVGNILTAEPCPDCTPRLQLADERAAFEAWYAKRHPAPTHENSTWAHCAKVDDWEVWQARAALAAKESP